MGTFNYNVNEVLATIFDKNQNDWKPSEKIPLVLKEIEKLKFEMKDFLDESGYNEADVADESIEMCFRSKSHTDEMKKCRSEIEKETMAEILKSVKNHDQIVKELQSVKFALEIVFDVVQCGKYVKEFDDGREAQSFSRAVEAVYDLLQYIEHPVEGYSSLDLYANTKNTAQLILDSLLNDLFNEWDRMVKWTLKHETSKTVVTITLDIDDSLIAIDVLNALEKSKKLKEKVSEFAKFLLKDVLIPIIHNDCTVYAETDELMTVTINKKPNYTPPYDAVISNLRLLFHYLSNKLNVEFSRHNTIMIMMGNEICVEFSDKLVKDCLIDTIPNNINELQNYGRITSEIESFQNFLTLVKFFPKDNFSILQYVNNIDVLFSNKSSEYFLETARDIMFRDLSVTMSIGVKNIPKANEDTTDACDDNAEEAIKTLEKTIPKSLFYFPRCMISKSAQELLDLIYMMMEQAVQCSNVVCKKLYQTTRLVFELYDAVVPYHHEKFLLTIPQYVALFHNNCMYLAHNLQTLGDKWLVLMEGRELDYPISFVDLVPKLRELGYKHLTLHMQQQRKQILDNIRSSDLNSMMTKDVLSNNAEAAMRQCLRQIQMLKNVWIGVFPINVFKRLMATLLDMFFEELIHRVCTVEDISMELALQLTELYIIVEQRAPIILEDAEELEARCKSWDKFQQLIFILGASLKEIEIRWNEGNGPLAVNFTNEELRNLIKALFQNTQYRSSLLSKMR